MARQTSCSSCGITVRPLSVFRSRDCVLMCGLPNCAAQEKSVLFVTNNATKSRKNYKKKFDSLGVEAHVVRLHAPYDMNERTKEAEG